MGIRISHNDKHVLKQLKIGFWLYFFLLFFEGALRKWVLPGLATPLLIVRDPVAIWMLYLAISSGVVFINDYIKLMWAITVLAVFTSLIFGHGNLVVALYGFRITAFHFPLIFIFASVLTKEDVKKAGEVLLGINIVMTLLVAVQFFSPQSAWVNRAVGGEEGSGFMGAAEYFRVPGTFSFTNGLSLFYGFVAPFILFFWINGKKYKVSFRALLVISTLCLFAAIPLSVSRTVLFEIIITLIFLLVAGSSSKALWGRLIMTLIFAAGFFMILRNFYFFQTATNVFMERFTTANEQEGGFEGVFLDRFLGGMIGAISESGDSAFWGHGLGMGTNAGAKLMSGNVQFLIAEQEWGRIIGEIGILLGMGMILIRAYLTYRLVKLSWPAVSLNNILPWLLCSFSLLSLLQGQWAQPTALGFATVSVGLTIAALKTR